jgi:hypothetical protein
MPVALLFYREMLAADYAKGVRFNFVPTRAK